MDWTTPQPYMSALTAKHCEDFEAIIRKVHERSLQAYMASLIERDKSA